jgi:hypothetical protein
METSFWGLAVLADATRKLTQDSKKRYQAIRLFSSRMSFTGILGTNAQMGALPAIFAAIHGCISPAIGRRKARYGIRFRTSFPAA